MLNLTINQTKHKGAYEQADNDRESFSRMTPFPTHRKDSAATDHQWTESPALRRRVKQDFFVRRLSSGISKVNYWFSGKSRRDS